jgi:hypothetical protein
MNIVILLYMESSKHCNHSMHGVMNIVIMLYMES